FVVLDVLEDVEADDAVDLLRVELGALRAGEREEIRRDPDVGEAPELRRQLPDVVRLDVGGDDALAVGEEARLVADAGADLQYPAPEVRLEALVEPLIVRAERRHPPERDRADVVGGRLPAEVLQDRKDGLERVLQADLLPFLVRAAVVRDRDLVDARAHPRDLARDLRLDAEPLALE